MLRLVPLWLLQLIHIKETVRTAVALPIEVLRGIAVASQFYADIFAGGTVGEGDVVVCDIVEEVDFVLVEEERGSDGVDWCVAPPFVKETPVLVKGFEEVDVGFATEPVEVADFKVRPLG